MSAPVRIQRQRTKGWRMPEGAVYVGRPSFWGNPFIVGEDGVRSRAEAAHLFRLYVTTGSAVSPDGGFQSWDPIRRLPGMVRDQLGGCDLVCWCPLDQPCHADVLLELANGWRTATAGRRVEIEAEVDALRGQPLDGNQP